MAKPFIKWAGGKTALIPRLLEIFPSRVERYYEPFIGGGAVFWAMSEANRFAGATLNDFNEELVNCYESIRGNVDGVIAELAKLTWDKETFLRLREEIPATPEARAARFIYLNKTCFNGLYRVNRKGKFNVPFGKFKSPPKFLDENNLRACSGVLSKTVLRTGDFAAAVKDAFKGDLVYFDPPYVPLSATSNFASYTRDGFTIEDQRRLAALCRELVARGVHVVASNSDTPIIREIYEGFVIHEVQVRRSINSKADKRGAVGEVIIVGNP